MELKGALLDVFPKTARESISWVKFDTVPSSSTSTDGTTPGHIGHVHPIRMNCLPEILKTTVPYTDDVQQAVGEILTNGIHFTLHARPIPFPPLAGEKSAAFTWGPDDHYAVWTHFMAVLIISQFARGASGFPGAGKFPSWLLSDLAAIPSKYDQPSGPFGVMSNFVSRTTYLAQQNRGLDDFMFYYLALNNGLTTEPALKEFIRTHSAKRAYDWRLCA